MGAASTSPCRLAPLGISPEEQCRQRACRTRRRAYPPQEPCIDSIVLLRYLRADPCQENVAAEAEERRSLVCSVYSKSAMSQGPEDDDLEAEYDFSGAVRDKYYQRYQEGLRT